MAGGCAERGISSWCGGRSGGGLSGEIFGVDDAESVAKAGNSPVDHGDGVAVALGVTQGIIGVIVIVDQITSLQKKGIEIFVLAVVRNRWSDRGGSVEAVVFLEVSEVLNTLDGGFEVSLWWKFYFGSLSGAGGKKSAAEDKS